MGIQNKKKRNRGRVGSRKKVSKVWLFAEESLREATRGSMANIAGSLALGIDIGSESVTAAAKRGSELGNRR